MNVRDKKILIVGFGKSGQAAARYCLSQGAKVTVTDGRNEKELDVSTCRLVDMKTYFGSHPDKLFTENDIIVVSPGVPLTLKGLELAKKKGIPVVGEMELVDIDAKIIAITGTNGKSTVTTLIGEILKEAGKKVCVGGNLGTPLLDMIKEVQRSDFVVLEVSSYQLEITPSFHPNIALLLNITPDHLDRYGTYEDYIAAKALIAANLTKNDYFIYNGNDELVKKIANNCAARKINFMTDVAQTFRSANISAGLKSCSTELDLSKAKIVGVHNKENMMAAAHAALIAGCDVATVQKVFEKFPGLPHRNQFVRELNGVKFFDDSKGTNVDAVVRSVEGFDSKIVLIAGGIDKGGSYSPLRELVKEKVKALVLIGEAKEKIKKELGDLTEVVMAQDMGEAVREAAKKSSRGDVVLLSPACASMDMFRDYAHRGNEFIKAVNNL